MKTKFIILIAVLLAPLAWGQTVITITNTSRISGGGDCKNNQTVWDYKFYKTIAQGWGWKTVTNATPKSSTCGSLPGCSVWYAEKGGATGCGTNTVVVQVSAYTNNPTYRFDVMTTNPNAPAKITLTLTNFIQ